MLDEETSPPPSWPRRITGVLAILAVLMMPMVGMNPPPAQAQYATDGEGLYKGSIDWFDFDVDGQPIPAEGAERTNTREIGDHTIATTCSISNIDGELATYRSGNYSGDALDNLYNVGGPDSANQLIAGIYTAENGGNASFDFECSVTLDGEPIDVGGLVFADAESSNESQGEYVQATTDEDVNWRVIDRFRNCDTSVIASRDGNTMRLHPDGTQCSEVNGTEGPMAIGFMEGATSARVELQGGGSSAVSVGVMMESDFGDAPSSYGEAGALIEPAWEGGEIPEGDTNVSDQGFTLGTPIQPVPRLGATVDSDSDYLASDDALGDDTTGNPESDEDGIEPPGVIDTTWGEEFTQEVECTGPGFVSGWIDWNANGTFDEGERSNVAECTGSTVSLTWTVPDDAVDSLEDEATFMRLRIASDEAAASSPTGITGEGEVEDHRVEVDVPNPGLTITKEADPADSATPGGTVDYTITVENTGEVDYTAEDPATFTDDLTGVLDDASYNDDAAASVGEVSYSEPELSWSGPLAVGESATITYSATVDDPVEGDSDLVNVVTGPEESNCPEGSEDPDCQAVVPIRDLQITKTADPSGAVLQGDAVTYTVEVTNTGQAAYTDEDPATFTDDLSGVLDDATYNDDAAADAGSVSYEEPTLSWSGALEPGQTATVTYSVTVEDPMTTDGDGILDNAVVGPEESNCLDGTEDDCHVPVPVQALHLEKTSDGAAGAVPGDTVTYSVEVTNTGQVPYTEDAPATFSDDLTEVLDDATYNGDAAADTGDVSYTEPTLSWSGALEPGETATVTYTVTVNDPTTGDGEMLNVIVGPEESNCTDPASTDPDCVEPDPIQELQIAKSSDAGDEPVQPGDTVNYTITVENSGQVPYTEDDPATFTDDLSGVLDDATYNDDAAADIGAASYGEPTLSWSGALEPGETATVTYSVTVNDPLSGDGTLENAVVGPEESNCDDGTEEDCHVPVPVQALQIAKTSDVDSATPGDTVTYSIEVTNTGQVAYTDEAPATFSDDLTEVLDDATYNDDASADIGAATYSEPTLSWSGALEPGETATVTYTVTVNDPPTGDGVLTNAVVGPEESNCDDGTEEDCNVPVPLQELQIAKTSDVESAIPGETVTYSVAVTNTGQVAYTDDAPATFTDDLTEVLDDATYNDDAAADIGAASYEEPTLSWSGALEPGETATVTYSVTVNDPLSGDGTLTNAVVGPEESNCLDGTEEDCNVPVPVQALHLEKTSDGAAGAIPGDTVTYSVAVTNTGQVAYTDEAPATFTDDLTEVLDDATYNEDASADTGSVSYEEPVLSWAGALEPGETTTITYSVTINDPPSGDGEMFNVVVGPEESNCTDPASTDPDCVEPDPIKELTLAKTSDAGDEPVQPGDTVTYTVTVENSGNVAYTEDDPATFTDDLTEVLDDAAYNDDAAADIGAASYEEPTLSWSGALEPGETATVTYSVTVNDPVSGDGQLTNAVVGPEESNCDDGTEEDCNVPIPVQALQIAKTSDMESATPGDTVTYSVAVTNTGQVPYTEDGPATFSDDLTEVLDDATYNDDASADIGAATYSEPTLSWSGALEPGETATVTYTVTVNDPPSGDGTLTNTVVGPEESNCDDGTEEDCNVPVPVQDLQIAKTSDVDSAAPGDTVTYSIEVTNTGQVAYTDDAPATFTDDLTEVLDDATYNDDASADIGAATYSEPTLSWSGALEPGETATVTYTVTVNDPMTGDGVLTNTVVGPEESNCDDGTEEGCNVPVPVQALQLVKSSDGAEGAIPGDTVTYSVEVTNTGQVAYTDEAPASFTDDLTEILDDATYNEDAAADVGAVSYEEPVLSWSGALEPGASATVTYSVTVNDPPTGDSEMRNVVVGPEESNCTDPDSIDPDCVEPNPIQELQIAKSSDAGDEPVQPGDTVTYSITVENSGTVPYTEDNPATFTDDLTEVLDDATYNDDAAADIGEASYGEPTLSWSGALEPGETATVTYSVTVNDPVSGDGQLLNTVVGPEESNCDDGTEEDCNVPVPVQALQLNKSSDGTGEAIPGDTVTYSVTVTNTGQVAYTDDAPATFTDDLTEVLDDSAYNGDGAADIGSVSYEEPVLSWSGALEPGQSATVTYSVTINDPPTGDGEMFNVVVGPEESNCTDPASTDPDCVEPDPIKDLTLAKTSDAGDEPVQPGDTVNYTITVENTGGVAYTDEAPATFSDDLTEVIDDATYNEDAAADAGAVSYSEPTLSWSGALEPGETATVTYSVTVNDPPTGDGMLTNAVVGPEESNCDDGTEEDCNVPVPVQKLQIAKTSDVESAKPGNTVTYSVAVTNTGQVAYTDEAPATFTDDLTEVLDDATYNEDAAADIGEASYEEPTLSWTGALEPGETAMVTYTVTVNDPPSGDGTLINTVVGPEESNCDDGTEEDCNVPVPVQDLQIAKTSDVDSAKPGDTVTYSVAVTNTGQVAYTDDAPATFNDDLTEVLDDATYNEDATSDIGAASYEEPVLSWSGALAPGETATVTYTATVNDPLTGDGTLTNVVVGPEESNCVDGTEEGCNVPVPVQALHLEKTSDGVSGAIPGDTITYSVAVTNTGQVAYTDDAPATFTDDLTEVLDDATYNEDAAADIGSVSYEEPVLSWAGPLEPGETATVTYSVTINDPVTGDENLHNVVVGPEESNCTDPASTDPDCVEADPVRALEIVKTSAQGEAVDAGDTIDYTVTVQNTGTDDYTVEDPAEISDVLDGVLDDAVYNEDVTADIGEATFADGTIDWSGPLASGETATITYSVTVNDPMTGDGQVDNVVLGPQESNCRDTSDDDTAEVPEDCQVITLVRSFEVSKVVDRDEAGPGAAVNYTVTVESVGTAPYTDEHPAGFTDDLSQVIDDATFDGEAEASAGVTSYEEPVLAWSGPLAVDGTATVDYTVTVNDPVTGDGTLTNVVAPAEGSAGHCTSAEDCTTNTVVPPPDDPTPAPTPDPTPTPEPTPSDGPTDGPTAEPTPDDDLARTGTDVLRWLLPAALLLMLGGGVLLGVRHRRE